MGQLGQISGGSGPGVYVCVCVFFCFFFFFGGGGGGGGLWVPAESIVKKSSCADPEIFARADKIVQRSRGGPTFSRGGCNFFSGGDTIAYSLYKPI